MAACNCDWHVVFSLYIFANWKLFETVTLREMSGSEIAEVEASSDANVTTFASRNMIPIVQTKVTNVSNLLVVRCM